MTPANRTKSNHARVWLGCLLASATVMAAAPGWKSRSTARSCARRRLRWRMNTARPP